MSTRAVPAVEDPFDGWRPLEPPETLAPFVEAGVLGAGEVHVAGRTSRIAGADPSDAHTLLAAALAVRAPRLQSVCVDIATVRKQLAVDGETTADLAELPWPETEPWLDALHESPAVSVGDDGPADRPVRLIDTRLYLDRLYRDERQVAEDLRARAASAETPLSAAAQARIDEIFPDGQRDHLQRRAVAVAAERRLTVVSGGPGTGKTTTVARILAALIREGVAEHGRAPLVALCAPTGKAAARLEEAVREASTRPEFPAEARDPLGSARGSTIHRLLGYLPGNPGRFRHNRNNRLPHDVVIVDESSMVGLPLMARLLEAVRGDARLVLVGDADQLASIEAGAVLGDIVGPASEREGKTAGPLAESVVVLQTSWRYGEEIADMAAVIRRGDEEAAIELLRSGGEAVRWIERPDDDPDGADLEPIREAVVANGRAIYEAAAAGDAGRALAALGRSRVLCAHRHGPHGVAAWTARIELWLSAAVPGLSADRPWYVGRPLLVTRNDYSLGLYNGDTGVIVRGEDDRTVAAFERRGEVALFGPSRLESVETVHAVTVHKAQGSQFEDVIVVLPDPDSRILTRELLYTALTRAREQLTVVGSEAAVRAAVTRRVARASGLRERLWT